MHPPIDGHVIDFDTAFDEQLFDIAIREAVPQVPADRENDHLRRIPEPLERRTRDSGHRTTTTKHHPASLTAHATLR